LPAGLHASPHRTYLKDEHIRRGYQWSDSQPGPHNLWETRGFTYYKENMYTLTIDEESTCQPIN
jgi:hypothetical protein